MNMKPTLTILTALLLAAAAHADLVAHLRFDGDLKDAAGRHDGRPVDPKLAPAFAPGRVGSAVVIEKINAGIELANPSSIDFSRDFTIATWVNVGNYYAEISPPGTIQPGRGSVKKVAAIVRESRPSIVLTHSPQDYMEDHMNASRLAVTAAFAHGIPNFQTEPPRPSFTHDVTVYHAMPHGLSDPLRQKIRAGVYVNTTEVHERKRAALATHVSQKHWLDVSQGMDSYLSSMDEMSRSIGRLSGRFEHAEGWRRHLHLGLSSRDIDPLSAALEADCAIDPSYESGLVIAR